MLTRTFATLALLLALCAASCADSKNGSWRSPRVVKIESDADVNSLFPSFLNWQVDRGAEGMQALLLREGDYVTTDDDLAFRYKDSDGGSLQLSLGEGKLKLGNVVVAVSIGDSDGLAWLEKASDQEMAALRSLSFDSSLDDRAVAAARRLAAVNPNVDIVWDGTLNAAAAAKILPIFRPKLAPANALLANRPEIETVVAGSEEGAFDVLPKLPGLRRLLITRDRDNAMPLPAGLASLRSLTTLEEVTDLSVIANAPAELEELTLNADRLRDIKGIERFTKLHTLVFIGEASVDLTPLSKLTGLRWVALPSGTTDAQFAEFVASHPDLAVLEMMKNDKITSLQPITGLKKLEAIVIGDERKDLDVLAQLKSLRFIGLSKKLRADAETQVEVIRKALPEAAIVAVEPFCLGSGWILALVPALLLAWVIHQRRRAQG